MSYLVLARKSRPQTFEEVVGQYPVVKTLQNSLLKKRVAHAILFSGVRGVGKTTLARIMAKAINCANDTGTVPCNTCNSCAEITEGSAIDLYEIDGASNRGIQEIRELKEKIRFLPTSARYKIIIIDEVHMLTTEAFNALLKTIEEPPEHVYFMFATTELHKIPITILSRCQRYELQRVSSKDLTSHFFRIAHTEGIEIEEPAMALIVRESEGSVRDGLSLLDQVFSFGEKKITKEDVIEVLGLIDRDILIGIAKALLEKDKAGALLTLNKAFTFGIDVKRFTTDLLDLFRTLLFCKINGCQELLDIAEDEKKTCQSLAVDYSLETIHLKISLLMSMADEIRFSPQPRLALETSFIKIIEAGNVTPVTTLLGQIDKLLAAGPTVVQEKPEQVKPTDIPSQNREPSLTTKPKAVSIPEVVEPPSVTLPSPPDPPPLPPKVPVPLTQTQETKPEENAPSDSETLSAEQSSSKKIEIHPHERDVRRNWFEFTEYVKDRKVWMSKDLQRADTAKQVKNELHIHFSDPANCTLLRNKDNHKLLTEFALDFFQKELKILFIIPDQKDNGEANDTNSPQMQRQRLVNDPLVQMTVEIFGGQVGDIRVGPRSR